ncbi:MAG: 4'-phosphopantetheinyl transferase superfamily protein [Woeseiaceae bacterium]|nr:4'-phosphopantetheinyl transferase superfamily protein [Woeseiaceae bacterium]
MRRRGPKRLVSDIAARIPGEIALAAAEVGTSVPADFPVDLIPARAVKKRQLEFVAGRIAAREAMEELGRDATYPGRAPDRRPLWPKGLVGSITHTADYAVAAAARSSDVVAVGIDLEDQQQLVDEIGRHILSDAEREAWNLDKSAQNSSFVSLFSYKEAIFKCVYPRVDAYIDFLDVELSPGKNGPSARCINPRHPAAICVSQVTGVMLSMDGRIFSACWILETAPLMKQ